MQRLLLIRHGIAESPEVASAAGRGDAERQLTADGRKKMHAAVRGLRVIVESLDALASSPLARAQETAAIIGKTFMRNAEILECLAPALDRSAVLTWLRTRRADSTSAIIGHEPDFSELAAWLLTGSIAVRIAVKKGAALLFEFPGEIGPGMATLLWSLPPKALQRLEAK